MNDFFESVTKDQFCECNNVEDVEKVYNELMEIVESVFYTMKDTIKTMIEEKEYEEFERML